MDDWLSGTGSGMAGGQGHDEGVERRGRTALSDSRRAADYAAISVSSVPVAIATQVKQVSEKNQQIRTQTAPGNTKSEDTAANGADAKKNDQSLAGALGALLVIGLASPFLELANPGSGVIGLFILFLGLSIAFRMTAAKPSDVDGPYSITV